jgi:hypothetical protein
MAIKLADETAQRLISSIKRCVSENTEKQIGDLDGVCYEPEFGYRKR